MSPEMGQVFPSCLSMVFGPPLIASFATFMSPFARKQKLRSYVE